MKSSILNYVDFERANTLLEGFNKATGFVTAILDLDGNILSKSGWREICTDFHRKNPETASNCTISDTALANKMREDEKYHFYKCINGLVDVGVPIVIRGEHIANLFSGQFFFEEPDMSFFKKQAKTFGFEELAYLEALGKVPVVSKEKVDLAMNFLLNITQMIIEMTAEKLDQIDLIEVTRNSEAALLESQVQLNQNMNDLLESQRIAHLGTWRLNLATDQVMWSEELYKMYGFDPTLPPPPYTEHMKLFTPESWEKLSTSLEHTRTSGIPYELELETVTIDSLNGWMWVRGEANKDSKGNIISLWGAAQDITERKKAEEKLRDSEKRFRDVVGNLNAGVVVHAPDTSIIDFNDRAVELLGLSKEQILGKVAMDPAWMFLSEDETQMPLADFPIGLILESKKPLKDKLLGIYKSADQSIKWVLVNGTPILNNMGNISEVIISFIDITDLKNSKDLILESEEKFKSYIENAPDGIFITNSDGFFIDANASACNMFACTKEELLDMHASQFLPSEEKQKGQEALETTSKTGNYKNEFKFLKKDGSSFYALLSSAKINKDKFIGFVKDITERKKSEDELAYLSFHDHLTCLYNRRFFEEELKRLDTEENLPLSIIMCDINGLKLVNDSFGHYSGDSLLVLV